MDWLCIQVANLHLGQQFACGRRGNEDLPAVGADEALVRAFLEQRQQRVVVAVDVQQPNLSERRTPYLYYTLHCMFHKNALLNPAVITHWFVVNSKLAPGYHLQQLLHCAVTPWQK